MPDLVQVVIGNLIERKLGILVLQIVIMDGFGNQMADCIIHIDSDYFCSYRHYSPVIMKSSKDDVP